MGIALSLVNRGTSELRLREGRSYKSSKAGEWHGIVSIRAAVPGSPPVKPVVRNGYGRDRFEMDFPSDNRVIPPAGELTTTSPFWDFEIDEVGEYCFRADYYLRESALVGRPTTTLEETASTTFCFEVVPFEELGIKVTPERAISIAGRAFAAAGYGEATLIKRVRRHGNGDWYTGHEFAPAGGGWHVLIVIDGQTGEVKRLEKGWHQK